MPGLYERLTGTHATRPRIPVHQFQALAAEWAKGNVTGAQTNAAITAWTGVGLDATEQTEVNDLVATVPTGTTADERAQRALRLQEIDQLLLLAEVMVPAGQPPLNTTAALRTRLGVPTR